MLKIKVLLVQSGLKQIKWRYKSIHFMFMTIQFCSRIYLSWNRTFPVRNDNKINVESMSISLLFLTGFRHSVSVIFCLFMAYLRHMERIRQVVVHTQVTSPDLCHMCAIAFWRSKLDAVKCRKQTGNSTARFKPIL